MQRPRPPIKPQPPVKPKKTISERKLVSFTVCPNFDEENCYEDSAISLAKLIPPNTPMNELGEFMVGVEIKEYSNGTWDYERTWYKVSRELPDTERPNENYEAELKQYNAAMAKYEKACIKWQDSNKRYKEKIKKYNDEKRAKEIAKAEKILKKYKAA